MAKLSSRSIIAERYARSLFELAQDSQEIEGVSTQISGLQSLFQESQEFQAFLLNPAIKGADQQEVIQAIVKQAGLTGNGAAGLVGRFLCVLTQNRRLSFLPEIIEIYQKIVSKLNKELSVQVISARALTPAQENKLKSLLEEASKHKIHLKTKVESSLLGGVIVRIGAFEIDASLLNRLSSLKLALKEVS